ncbi:carboxypeptidase regulatory-like domain-containing protein [Terracidiphilus sp.]|uniref:carboxypeptidase regulatory-like domain-containing protein n=1 Tax=Terracidiphilus sp. TaxID=1964191 RepID=UPI003C29D145
MSRINVRQMTHARLSAICTMLPTRHLRKPAGLLFGLLLAALLVVPQFARAQELTATLAGTVTDTSGAVIPNAAVTVTENATKAVHTVQSDASGSYVITTLPAGAYTVSVVSSGFENYLAKDVVLLVAEKRGLNVQLKAGAASTTVTVEAAAVAVDTESSAQAGTLTGEQITELELADRNFQELVTLQPGVVNQMGDETLPTNIGMSVNGARTSANNWTIDGADINDSGSNATIVNAPNVDAIQEFTLQRGSYDAGYGRSGGGQVLVATKAGSSTFHGEAYEFVRNTVLDANEWFNKRSQIENGEPNEAAVNHRNVYGFTIGGPAYIPHLYNTSRKKTFFFWAEEWRDNDNPGGGSFPAATQNDLNGVVAGNYTGAPAGCATYSAESNSTTISPSCYSANSQVYIKNIFDKYPANGANGFYTFAFSALNNYRDDIVRVDHYFNDKVHFFARYLNDTMPSDDPEGLWAGSNYPNLTDTSYNSPGRNVVGNLTWTINPKVVNEFEFVWAQGSIAANIKPGQFATSTSVNQALTDQWQPDPYGKVPAITITGVTGFNAGSSPYKERNLDRTIFDNLALTFGKHTLRLGFQTQWMVKTENAVNGNPNFSFNSWADFLVGNVATFSQVLPDIIPDLHFTNSEAYIQDDWKITRRLMLNLGVRWSRFPSPTDLNNTLSNFDPNFYASQFRPQIDGGNATTDTSAGNFLPGQFINGNQLIPATYTNGMIFPTGKACTSAQAIAPMSSCSPWGSYVNQNDNANFGPRIGFAYDLFGTGKTVIRGGFGIFYDRLLDGIWEQNAFTDPPFAQRTTIVNAPFDNITGGSTSVPLGPNGIDVTGNPTFKVPSYGNFNLSVQHQVLPSTVVELAYVGNTARHLLGEYDMNQPTVASRLTAPTESSVNYIRPFAGYADILTRLPAFSNNYNALQFSINHHSHGLQLGLAYTFSKDLTNNSSDRANVATNTYNFHLDYGPSTYNQPQTFTANYVYDLPWFRQQHGFTGKVLGGWEASGITQFWSGTSFSLAQPFDPYDPTGINVGIGMSAAGIAPRPDQIASVSKPKSVNGWFSTSSFAPAIGHFGSEGNGSLLGPGYNDWDLAAIKNIKFLERMNFQFRAEFFNAFNHESFSTVDSSLADSTFYGGSGFGDVTAGHSPRRIQFGGKISF